MDIGAAKLADTPQTFDVLVMPNLYGDILSDVAAQLTGSVGLAGSANIGQECAIFEATHGSAPRRAGQNLANPSGLLQGAILMLNHIGQGEVASRVQNAWLKTLEEGIHTYDIYREGISRQQVGTREFAQAVIARLGQQPSTLKPAAYGNTPPLTPPVYQRRAAGRKDLLGVDVFIHWPGTDPAKLADQVRVLATPEVPLRLITNRGIKVWPDGFSETFCTDHWRCRFLPTHGQPIDKGAIVQLLAKADTLGIDTIKTENLYAFDGQAAFSLGQGQ